MPGTTIATTTTAATSTAATPTETETENSTTTFDLSEHLPLQLVKSEIIPPSPNRSESAIDWLADFEGYSWIAYGASSLLVISHFPSPLSECENLIGPFFRQVVELSSDGSGSVSAASWSPVTPSVGELAASLDNCIGLFSYNSEGSFCWSQTAILVQSTRVEAIKWTGSGDGIITGGIEVVLWRRKGCSWEIAWKFRPELPQALLSATSSIGGAFATASLNKVYREGSSSAINDASRCVLVSHGEGKSKHVIAELRHPLPISMIQWRPSASKQSDKISRSSRRLFLLTCCADGTVRLWSEMDDGRVRKTGKDINDQRSTGLSFRVAAVIEMNQAVNGILGKDVFVQWATELDGIVSIHKEARQYYSTDEYLHDSTGNCEWLIAVGPQRVATLWAVHCLDDVSPPRFPRVTLWKRLDVMGIQTGIDGVLLHKVVISRNQAFGPPLLCSVVCLLACNSLAWLQLNSQKSFFTEDGSLTSESDDLMSFCANKSLNMDSHAGKILQLAVHFYGCEQLAASLGTEGLLLFWSLSNGIMGLPTLNSYCKLSGKFEVQDSLPKYTSLSWSPATIGENKLILLGHVGGIDCLLVKFCENEDDKVLCHKLCSIPFPNYRGEEGPTGVWSVPLMSNSNSDNFVLLAIWKNGFQALSWKVTIHSYDFPGSSSDGSFDIRHIAENRMSTFESNFSGKRYFVSVDLQSSILPDPHNHGEVTSFAVVTPSQFVPLKENNRNFVDGVPDKYFVYHMVTGGYDGILKLWRSVAAQPLNSNPEWELVGVLASHEGPINRVSPSDCGRRIATISPAHQSNTSSVLRIWECVHLAGVGSFILEDTLFLDEEVVSLKWLTMGNGQLLLGICLKNKLQVYATNRCGVHSLVESKNPLEKNIWFCVAVSDTCPAICDFFWGPKATAIVVHDDYFCLYSQWLLPVVKKLQGKCHPKSCKDIPVDCNGGSYEHVPTAIFTDSNICDFKDLTMKDIREECRATDSMKMNVKNYLPSTMFERFNQEHYVGTGIGLWSLTEVAEKFGGSLPVYHPEALLINIYSGNWKRSLVALRHLDRYLTLNKESLRSNSLAKSSRVIPPIDLPNYLEGLSTPSSSDKAFNWSGDPTFAPSSSLSTKDLFSSSSSWNFDGSSNSSTSSLKRSELSGLGESIEKLSDLAAISNFEKLQILAIADLLDEVSNPNSASAYGSLDEPGQRFWLPVRFQQLYFTRRCGRLPSMGELVVNSGMTAWAFYSDCQESLFNSLLTNEASWQEMRKIGVGFWYKNAAQLRVKMEKLARQQYLKSKDPKACALLYIALNRLQVLAGLFKISKDEKDKPLVGFLSRNFQEEKNKAAALKNAYVLMGRHQLELAVAFFLLGGDAISAINVCAKNLGDEQLALVICRLVEGSGGPLESHLISKFLLSSAIEKGDYWLTSFLQWMLGNYSQAFLSMLGSQMDSLTNNAALLSNHASFLDPSIGHYCLMLATKNSMKNSIGELNAAILGRWAILMRSTALSRCGLPLEALESLSSSQNMFGGLNQGGVSNVTKHEILNERLKPSPNSSSNWIVGDVALQMELRAKSDFAMKYIIQLLGEHPSWQEINMASPGACVYSQFELQQQKMLLASFEHKLTTVLAYFEQKFSLIPLHLINMIIISLSDSGLGFIGYHIFEWYSSKDLSQKEGKTSDASPSCPILSRLLWKATEEMSYLCSRYIVACCMTCSHMKSCSTENSLANESRWWPASCGFYMQGLQWSLWHVRAALKLFSNFCAEFITKPLIILELYEYNVYFASAWLQRNSEGLILAVKPHLITGTNDHVPSEANEINLNKLLCQIAESLAHNRSTESLAAVQTSRLTHHEQAADMKPLIPIDERWKIIQASLWGFMSWFLKHRTDSLLKELEDNYSLHPPHKLFSIMSNSTTPNCDADNLKKQIELIFVLLAKLIKIPSEHISSYCATRLAAFLLRKIGDRSSPPTLQWLEEFSKSRLTVHYKNLGQGIPHLSLTNNDIELSAFECLWDCVTDPKILSGGLALELSKWSQYLKQKHSRGWSDECTHGTEEFEGEENCDQDDRPARNFPSNAVASPRSPNSPSVVSSGSKDSTTKTKFVPCHNPKEICKRNGELLEALCINSTDQKQAAIASNKKGIIFFSWEDGLPSTDKSDYIWTEVDWPHDGWAGSESIPVPTCVSPGVGLGKKKGTHLGLGGATIGVDSFARPGRDFTGGGAFGIPGYAGVGASGLGWETQEDFEDFVDPPATLENVRTRAFSSHPSRPFFLVGSSNTHIYLWEFGKDRAIATYGVLPAANVPPPYALASISAVQFDQCGQRFATAASDGTVCTWQLEVGGRSNIHPTESSLCFNNYTSDVTYVTGSGSIIAATGYSSNNINVVIWDTLAPPTTSRASIMCHEGGARSLSVFANDVGSGSISPLIVTGGKGGDVGVHDFRYIATGRTKRHRNSDSVEPKINASSTAGMQSKHGDQNRNGMLWYVPKAHSGSVTRISAIPNTSFFLTGSKDGDVKLWDAKRAKLVFHWPKLHDRHTFLQPNSRGFGGVVRAAVTDIQVVSHGFISCGGDGSVKLVELKDF